MGNRFSYYITIIFTIVYILSATSFADSTNSYNYSILKRIFYDIANESFPSYSPIQVNNFAKKLILLYLRSQQLKLDKTQDFKAVFEEIKEQFLVKLAKKMLIEELKFKKSIRVPVREFEIKFAILDAELSNKNIQKLIKFYTGRLINTASFKNLENKLSKFNIKFQKLLIDTYFNSDLTKQLINLPNNYGKVIVFSSNEIWIVKLLSKDIFYKNYQYFKVDKKELDNKIEEIVNKYSKKISNKLFVINSTLYEVTNFTELTNKCLINWVLDNYKVLATKKLQTLYYLALVYYTFFYDFLIPNTELNYYKVKIEEVNLPEWMIEKAKKVYNLLLKNFSTFYKLSNEFLSTYPKEKTLSFKNKKELLNYLYKLKIPNYDENSSIKNKVYIYTENNTIYLGILKTIDKVVISNYDIINLAPKLIKEASNYFERLSKLFEFVQSY